MAPPNVEVYGSFASSDVENATVPKDDDDDVVDDGAKAGGEEQTLIPPKQLEEKPTYDLSFPFQLMSGTVWFSMFLWGIWISTFYSMAVMYNKEKMNIVFPDLYMPEFPVASFAMSFHFIGAAYMSLAGCFQLVKYIRKRHPTFHRWVGRFYILASLIASIGGLVFIFNKGSYGGKPADLAFATYGFVFLFSAIMCAYNAVKRDFNYHKLWAWRLYSLSLAAWIYRFDYYIWMVPFGKNENSWLHKEDYQGLIDYWINWAFWVPGVIVVEIVFRMGETATLPSFWTRVLHTIFYCIFIMAAVFTVHAAIQLWVPSVVGTYDYEHGWIM